MQSIFLSAGCLLLSCLCSAQSSTKLFIYGNVSGDFGSPIGFRSSLSCLFAKHHELSAGFNYYSRRGRDIPADYHNAGFFSNKDTYPQQTYSALRFTYDYVLYPKRRADMLRFVIGAGISYGRLSSPYNYVKNTSGGIFSFTNWTNDTRDEQQTMFLANAALHFTPTRGFGLSAGPYVLLSQGYSGGGISAGLLFGKVGSHIHLRDPAKVAASRARHQQKMFWKKK